MGIGRTGDGLNISEPSRVRDLGSVLEAILASRGIRATDFPGAETVRGIGIAERSTAIARGVRKTESLIEEGSFIVCRE